MALTKPPVLPAWAEAGDKVQPSNAEIQAGWPLSNVPPSRQRFNWLLNFLANGIRYLTRRGMPDYGADETYMIGDRVIGDDGKTYRSIQDNNTGNAPSASPLWWERWGFGASELSTELNKLDYKTSCRVATTANLAALSGLLTIDGVVLVAGDRVLVKDQAVGSQNGIYVASVGAWARAADADDGAKLNSGAIVPVEAGTVNGDTLWMLTTDGAITIGVTSLAFSNIQGNVGTAGTYNSVTTDAKGRVIAGQSINYLRKNGVINGDGRVAQGSANALSGSLVYGAPDMWLGAVVNGTVSGGLLVSTAWTTAITDSAIAMSGLTTGAGAQAMFATRIEAKDAKLYNGKQVTVSCLAYHDVGATINWDIQVRKANSADNFSAVTAISTSAQQPVANTSATRLTHTFTVAEGDASNGLEIVFRAYVGAVANKNPQITEAQIEIGASPTEFEVLPYETVKRQCERYYERSYNDGIANGTNTSLGAVCGVTQGGGIGQAWIWLRYRTQKRINPTMLFYNPNATNSQNQMADQGGSTATIGILINNENTWLVRNAGGALSANNYCYIHFVADARL